jgi:hypothetical protein
MLWTWKNACNATIEPDVALYDMTLGGASSTYVLQTYDENLSQSLTCTTGDKICFGAWWGTEYWGCGDGCAESCTNCCFICGSELSLPVEDLNCN